MHANISIVQFQPGTAEEAMSILRDVMLPGASKQKGFKGALIFQSDTQADKYIIISLWETEADLLASGPPDEIMLDVERLGELIADANQDRYRVVFRMEE